MTARGLTSWLILAALCASQPARAQTAPPSSASSTPPPAAPGARAARAAPAAPAAPLPLWLSLGHSKLEPEAIRRAIELELRRPVALVHSGAPPNSAAGEPAQSLSVVVHADHTVSISYHAANGVMRTRSIGLPQDDARDAETIALLSGNLSRDEAAELLAELAAEANTPAAEPAPESAAAAPVSLTPPAADAAKKPAPGATVAENAPHTVNPKNKNQTTPGELLTLPYPAFDLTLVYPMSSLRHSQRYLVNWELGLVYGRIGGLQGGALNVLVLRVDRDVRGASYATFYNCIGGVTRGFSGAALVTRGGGVQGGAVGGLATLESGDSQGVQIAGIFNYAERFRGLQLAGLVNDGRDAKGLQVAGTLNAAGKFSGLQFSGIANVADEINGVQIGLVNVAGQVHGMQIGVVNVAKHVDGTSLGLVSVAGNGRVQPVLWASTFQPLNLAAKFTVGSFYTQLGGGFAPGNHTYTYELGLGAHVPVGSVLVLEPGVHYSEQRDTTRAFSHELSENVHYRLLAGLDWHSVSPFLGAALVQRFAHTSDAPDSHALELECFGGVTFF